MNYKEFKQRIANGEDIDHQTALKMIDEMWSHFNYCAELMTQECIDDGEEISQEMLISGDETNTKLCDLTDNATWTKK